MKISLAMLLAHRMVSLRRKRRRGRRKSGSCADVVAVDSSARLPLELIEFIVERLSLRQRVQLLCVCKAWNRLLRNSVAAELEAVEKAPWLVLAKYCFGPGWEVVAFRITGSPVPQVSVIPPNLLGSCNGSLPACQGYHDLHPYPPRLAGSGGFMCCLISANAHPVATV
ncbi:hypothetical protein L7F22_047327 [Adiantum nelumboides]|nr:hypothetical protein [Adiantum nelumboides]